MKPSPVTKEGIVHCITHLGIWEGPQRASVAHLSLSSSASSASLFSCSSLPVK